MIKRKKFSKALLEKLHVGDLLIYTNHHGELVLGWIVKTDLNTYDTFCAVQWNNNIEVSYMYAGDVLVYHKAYKKLRRELGI